MKTKKTILIMKKYLSISIVSILVLSTPGIATLTVTSAIGGIPTVSDATLENFNEPLAQNPILTLSGSAYLLTGSSGSPYLHFPPYFSGSTATVFGESPTIGLDSSQYVVVEGQVGNSSATLSFSTPQYYLGLLWGTIWKTDSLTFYDSTNNNIIGTVLGTDVPTAVFDGQVGLINTSYVNITSTTAFSRVVATSLINSFEFDDVAYAVPEPVTLLLLGLGAAMLRRKF